jgi:hypothetical protein
MFQLWYLYADECFACFWFFKTRFVNSFLRKILGPVLLEFLLREFHDRRISRLWKIVFCDGLLPNVNLLSITIHLFGNCRHCGEVSVTLHLLHYYDVTQQIYVLNIPVSVWRKPYIHPLSTMTLLLHENYQDNNYNSSNE